MQTEIEALCRNGQAQTHAQPLSVALKRTTALSKDANLPDNHIMLTFDDGPKLPHTMILLDILKRCGIKAHFFLVGRQATRHAHKTVIRQMVADGHVVGSHTQTHKYKLAHTNFPKAKEEVTRGHRSVENALGFKTPFFRFPYGSVGPRPQIFNLLHDWDLVHVFWNLRSRDTSVSKLGRLMSLSIESYKKHGKGIWVGHDRRESTVRLVVKLIPWLMKEGAVFSTIKIDGAARGSTP